MASDGRVLFIVGRQTKILTRKLSETKQDCQLCNRAIPLFAFMFVSNKSCKYLHSEIIVSFDINNNLLWLTRR